MSTMLPAIPATFGRLSEVFISSLGSITGDGNSLNLRPANRAVTILVDGLGAQNLKAAGGHAPFLNTALAKTKPIACGFPSTTATSITSFATGLGAGAHGIVGYKIFDRQSDSSANLLTGWGPNLDPLVWQPNQTVVEAAANRGIAPFAIGPGSYADSGFTKATMRGANYIAGKSISDRIDEAIKLLRGGNQELLAYLYIPELDQAAHASGVSSQRWLEQLEEVDSQVRRLAGALGKGDGLLLTADHGIVDIPVHRQIFLDECDVDWTQVRDVSGDPRVNFVYLNEAQYAESFASRLQQTLGEQAIALTRSQVLQAGWYGQASVTTVARMPDVFVLALKQVALYQRTYSAAKSLEMIGQHGGLSPAELQIPVLAWGAFAS